MNGYSTTTNYDPERLSRSRDASPHRPHDHEQQSYLTLNKPYTVQNNLLSPPNLVPLPVQKLTKNMADHTITHHQLYTTTKTISFSSSSSSSGRSYKKSEFTADSVDACYKNGIQNGDSKTAKCEKSSFTAVNGQSKFSSEVMINEFTNGRECKSFIQQRVERLYGPGALAQGFFVMKRQKSRNSESETDRHLNVPKTDEKHSKSMDEKLLEDGDVSSSGATLKQSSSNPTLPVLRHLRPEFRAQLPIVSPRKGGEGTMPKSITVPKIGEQINGNDRSKCSTKKHDEVSNGVQHKVEVRKESGKKSSTKLASISVILISQTLKMVTTFWK